MVLNVTGRHFKVWPELHDVAVEATEKFTKLNEQITRTDIVLSEEHGKFAEFTVHVNSHVYNAKESADNFDKSIHAAAEKILAQLRKLKEKQTDYR